MGEEELIMRSKLRKFININEIEIEAHKLILKKLSKKIKEYNDCKVIVEIGVSTGNGALGLIEGNPDADYYGYDSWTDYDEPNYKISKKKIEKYLPKAHLTRIDSKEIKELPKADLIHIDGDHATPGCLSDIELASKFLSLKGVILVHDMDYSHVMNAVNEWYEKNKSRWNRFDFMLEHGWAIIWKK